MKLVEPSKIKENIKTQIFNNLQRVNGVLSVTLVGSFIDDEDSLDGISDIDTIVVCDKLSKELFNDCEIAINNIDLIKCGLTDYGLKINTTFGPLKFDKPKLAVIHLMIYDIRLHINHVISSPFTCFDWERSNVTSGIKLKDIYPVGSLQYCDLMKVRRSLSNYINDIEKNVISYREYSFKNDEVHEIKKVKILDKKHVGEYSYHIVKNLISNYLKINNKTNVLFTKNEIISQIKRLNSKNKRYDHVAKYTELYQLKKKRSNIYPDDTTEWIKEFLIDYQFSIKKEWDDAISIKFIRHFQTPLSDDTFLGQGRNPGLINNSIIKNKIRVEKIISSPLRRCRETAEQFYQYENLVFDDRLMEFDYGRAEGLTYNELINKYPMILKAWKNGEDIKFPHGENTEDLNDRLQSFLLDLSIKINKNKPESVAIITHNGILRCLVGSEMGLEMKDWYRLEIPFAEPIEFLYHDNNYYPNFSRKLWYSIIKNIGYKKK